MSYVVQSKKTGMYWGLDGWTHYAKMYEYFSTAQAACDWIKKSLAVPTGEYVVYAID